MIDFDSGFKKIILIAFMLVPFISMGQSLARLSGKITDSDGEPIPQAYVFVDNTVYQTTTDEKENTNSNFRPIHF
jgi:hypothetical protein